MSNETENYKGELQHKCHQKGVSPPEYQSNPVGSPNDLLWIVTVKWGDSEHTTPEPIAGSKKTAEQVAAGQVLGILAEQDKEREDKRDAYLSLNRGNALADALSDVGVEADVPIEDTELPTGEPITVPVELVTTALGIANHRLNEIKRDQRHQRPREDNRRPFTGSAPTAEDFSKQLAQLTMEIVRHIHAEADKQGIRFAEETKSEEITV